MTKYLMLIAAGYLLIGILVDGAYDGVEGEPSGDAFLMLIWPLFLVGLCLIFIVKHTYDIGKWIGKKIGGK